MQRVVGAPRELAIDRDQILHRRDFRRENDLVAPHAEFFRARGGQKRRAHHRLAHHRPRVGGLGLARVLVHQMREQFLVERAPIGADAHGLLWRSAISMIAENCRSRFSRKPTLPGLMRYLSSASAQAG